MSTQLRVLVVDDEIDSATSLTSLLQSMDCQTTCAFRGDTGTRMAQLFGPDLVFLDLEMPGGGGCEVLAEIQAAFRPGTEPMFVCLTGNSSTEAEDRCWRAGFHRFVRKPMLQREIREVLDQARAQAVQRELNHQRVTAARAAGLREPSRSLS